MRQKTFAVYIASCLLLVSLRSVAQFPVYDNFEGTSLSKLWDTTKFVKGSVQIQSHIVHSGQRAVAVTLHEGEKFEAGNATSEPSERAELLEAENLLSKENANYEYAFSMFIPADFPIVPTRLVLAQWKQNCKQETCSDAHPVLALRYENGVIIITMQTSKEKKTIYSLNRILEINGWISNSNQIFKNWQWDCYVLDKRETGCRLYR